MNISFLLALNSPAFRVLCDGIVPSAAVAQILDGAVLDFDSLSGVPPSVDNLSLADAVAGLVCLCHDGGARLVAEASGRDPSDGDAARTFLAVIAELQQILDSIRH